MSILIAETERPALSDPMIPRPAVIREIRPEAYGISTFSVEFLHQQDREAFSFSPGQFNMIYLPSYGESAISISSDPATPQRIDHTIRFAGSVTRALARLEPGDMIGLRGPFGSSWPVTKATERDLLIVAGGIGLAPLRPVLYTVMQNRGSFRRVILLYGARTPADLLYSDELEEWKTHEIEVHVTVDRADETWKGHVGVVPLLFYRIRLEEKNTVVMTCGPEVMMRFVIYESIARRIDREDIWVSLERNMKCGIGFCGHCQFGPQFICREGPVLAFPRIEPFFLKEEF